ncbi:hypothetical protein [Neptunicella sp. SCSIO 80796]|uniref:hypothetical protein n=1 Tax=Neptunicella plasticusilytica TaxID=3117012 RepID=UPI003A4D89A1
MIKLSTAVVCGLLSAGCLANTLEGVWKLVSAKHQYEGEQQWVTLDIRDSFVSYKILKDGYYSVITQDAGKKIFGAKMGRYQLADNHYSEQFIAHDQPQFIGKRHDFTYKLAGENWFIYSDDIVEQWQRVTANPNLDPD